MFHFVRMLARLTALRIALIEAISMLVSTAEPQRVWPSAEVQRETIAALARKTVPQPQPQLLGRLWAWLVPARASVRRAR